MPVDVFPHGVIGEEGQRPCNFYCHDGWHAENVWSSSPAHAAVRLYFEGHGLKVLEVRDAPEIPPKPPKPHPLADQEFPFRFVAWVKRD